MVRATGSSIRSSSLCFLFHVKHGGSAVNPTSSYIGRASSVRRADPLSHILRAHGVALYGRHSAWGIPRYIVKECGAFGCRSDRYSTGHPRCAFGTTPMVRMQYVVTGYRLRGDRDTATSTITDESTRTVCTRADVVGRSSAHDAQSPSDQLPADVRVFSDQSLDHDHPLANGGHEIEATLRPSLNPAPSCTRPWSRPGSIRHPSGDAATAGRGQARLESNIEGRNALHDWQATTGTEIRCAPALRTPSFT